MRAIPGEGCAHDEFQEGWRAYRWADRVRKRLRLLTRLLENNALKRREIGVPAVEPRVEGADRDIGLAQIRSIDRSSKSHVMREDRRRRDQARHGLTAATLQARPHAGRSRWPQSSLRPSAAPRMTSLPSMPTGVDEQE